MLKIVVEPFWSVKMENYRKMIFEYTVDDVLEQYIKIGESRSLIMAYRSKERYHIDPSTPISNIRNCSESVKEERESIQSPYFKTEKLTNIQKPNQKHKFLESLITKIKSVQRDSHKSIASKMLQKNELNELNFHVDKNKNISHVFIKREKKAQIPRFGLQFRNKEETITPKIDFQQLQEQNFILKTKMSELIVENEKLKIEVSHLKKQFQENLQQSKRQRQHKVETGPNQSLLLSFQSYDLISQQQMLKEKCIQLSFSNIKFQNNDRKLSLKCVIDQVILPTQNHQLTKAMKQIKDLKHQKMDIQKRYTTALNQYRKQKQKEIEELKRGFSKNLNYYKQLIHKLTVKPIIVQTKRQEQDTLQSALFQTSLLDQQ